MKKILLMTTLLISSSYSLAHCPSEIMHEGEKYCVDFEWGAVERKGRKGEYTEVENSQGPVRVPFRENVRRWNYSKVMISVWKDQDKNHNPVFLEGLRFFPYMNMQSGHHHGGANSLTLSDKGYVLSQMPLHQMSQGDSGCWSIRWTFNEEDFMKDSTALTKIMSFQNLNDDENNQVMESCMAEGDDGGRGGHHHGH